MEFRARGSVRRIERSGYYSSTPASEWRNRIQEVALVRDGRDLNWHFAVGRVGGRYTAAAGPFDGLEFQRPRRRRDPAGGLRRASLPTGATWVSAPTTSWRA